MMKLVTMGSNDNQYQYWRCNCRKADQYTNVYYDKDRDHEFWLKARFDEVELRMMTLPAWRLYQVVN